MKRIGTASNGNVIVEMTSDEFDSLELTICHKPPTPPPPPTQVAQSPTPKQMTIKEIADYAIPRIQKSRPKKKASLVKFIEAMFQFCGGLEPTKIEQVIVELSRRKLLSEIDGKVTYLDV